MAIGRVAGAFGAEGHLKVLWLGDGPEHLLDAAELWLARSERDPLPRRFMVEGSEVGPKSEVIVALAGLRSRRDAEGWKGFSVLVSADALQPLAADDFYWHELPGFRVDSTSGEVIGTVRELWETGAHDVLVVVDSDGMQHLIPTSSEFVVEIDREARRVVVAVIEGLLDAGVAAGEGGGE